MVSRKTRVDNNKTVLGWREWCSFEALGLPEIAAKIDTGAKSCSLHAYHLKYFEKEGAKWVSFQVRPSKNNRHPSAHCQAHVIEMRKVTSSNGHSELRPVIETPLTLGNITVNAQVTLTNRDEMGYRLLIGRQVLAQGYLVDSSLSWLLGERESCSDEIKTGKKV